MNAVEILSSPSIHGIPVDDALFPEQQIVIPSSGFYAKIKREYARIREAVVGTAGSDRHVGTYVNGVDLDDVIAVW